MMMKHLLWKDAITLRPLIIAILVGIIGVNLMMLFLSAWLNHGRPDGLFVSLWILMPNLVALGAPALLVGGEEETGTLSWLRTLPVRWQRVVDAKVLAAVIAVALTWVASSLVMTMIQVVVRDRSAFATDMLSLFGVSYQLFFSVLLLLTGFCTAYLFRSPVAGLIALIPSIAVLSALVYDVGNQIATAYPRSVLYVSNDVAKAVVLYGGGLFVLLIMWGLQRWLGRRRLRGTPRTKRTPRASHAVAYQPPFRNAGSRPSPTFALLWQQTRQIIWPAMSLTLVIAVCLWLDFDHHYRHHPRPGWLDVIASFAPLLITLGACWLGAITFYGDTIRRRCAYFADRGLSPSHVWWTRIAVPMLLSLGLFAIACFLNLQRGATRNTGDWLVPMLILVGFACGQLVAIWTQRPALAFFGTPAYLLASSMLLFFLFSIYRGYDWTILLILPVLLLASWHLCSRWLEGRFGWGFHLRVIAYTLVAAVLPVVMVVTLRTASTPAEMPNWRKTMLAMSDPAIARSRQLQSNGEMKQFTNLISGVGSSLERFDAQPINFHLELLQKELDSEASPGQHVGYDDIDTYLDFSIRNAIRNTNYIFDKEEGEIEPDDLRELRFRSVKVLLKWATIVRESAARGEVYLGTLNKTAEPIEYAAWQATHSLAAMYGKSPELTALIGQFPSKDLRRESRRIALICEWRRYDATPWKSESNGMIRVGKAFGGEVVAPTVNWIPWERTRADRFIDLATRRTLEQLPGLPSRASDSYRRTAQLWSEAYRPTLNYHVHGHSDLAMHNEIDQIIADLKKRYTDNSESP